MANLMTFADALQDALLLCQGADIDEPEDGAATAQGMRVGRNILRLWQTKGLHMSRRTETVLPLVVGQRLYHLSDDTDADEWCLEDDFFTTTASVAAVITATSLTVTDTTDFTDGDRVGVETLAGERFWTTATKSGFVLTLAGGLTAAVAVGASVYFYTARPARPLRVLHARRRSTTDASDVPMRVEAMRYYEDQTAKTSNGTPVFVSYQPTTGQGSLYVWQPAGSVLQQLRMTVERPYVLAATTDLIPDISDEFNMAFVYALAKHLEPTYGHLDAARRRDLRADADRYEQEALAFDTDSGSIYFQPASRRGRRW